MISPARSLAFRVLKKVHGGGYASDLLRHESVGLDARDAGLAETIVMGVLRYQGQLDFLIGYFAGRKQPKLDLEVRIALHMGIYQLRYLDRIPAARRGDGERRTGQQPHKPSSAPDSSTRCSEK